MKKEGYLLAFTTPLLAYFGYQLGGYWNLLSIGALFVVEPLIDAIAGLETSPLSKDRETKLRENRFYRRLLHIWCIVQIAYFIWALYVVAYGDLATWYEWVGFLFATSIVTGGIGITIAHELGHKTNKLDKLLSKMLLTMVLYNHYYVEHNRGHHVHVGTPSDPATARKGLNIYFFWFRTVFLSYLSAWKIENISRKQKGLPVISLSNQMIQFTILNILFVAGTTTVFWLLEGRILWEIPLFIVAQSIVSFTLLEFVNYIEHYGLMRKELSPGVFEKVNLYHSWNSSHKLSNYFLFKVQMHSDHHIYGTRPYQLLRHYDNSPQLPAGYPTMILISLIPPLWFGIMDKKLDSWNNTLREPS